MNLIPFLLAAVGFPGFQKPVQDIEGIKGMLPVVGRVTCLLFVATECPIANRLVPEMRRIVEDHKNVAFFFVYPDRRATRATLARHRKAFGLNAPCIADPKFEIAKMAWAKVTPEAVVFGTRGNRVYRGRINDLFTEHNVTLEKPTVNDLRDALRAILAGKAVAEPYVAAVGCPIPFPNPKLGP